MAGLTTHPPIEAAAAAGRAMKKEELVAYLAYRGWRRYGVKFDISLLNDLIKNALMWKAKPFGHVGRRTIYGYNWKSYRRGLQIIRMRRAGPTTFDAIRVQLFRCGYSLPAHDVKTALWNEYRLFAVVVNSSVRSRYADNAREIGAAHEASMVRSFGELDPDFDAAGWRMAPRTYVEGYRAAKAAGMGRGADDTATRAVVQVIGRRLSFDALGQALAGRLMKGLMMIDPPAKGDQADRRDYVERLIMGASPATLTAARETCAAMCIGARRVNEMMSGLGIPIGIKQTQTAATKVAKAARQREWGAFYLVLALREVERDTFRINPEKMLNLIDKINAHEFKLTAVFASLFRLQRR